MVTLNWSPLFDQQDRVTRIWSPKYWSPTFGNHDMIILLQTSLNCHHDIILWMEDQRESAVRGSKRRYYDILKLNKQANWETNFKGARTMSYQLTISEDRNSGKGFFIFSPKSHPVCHEECYREIVLSFCDMPSSIEKKASRNITCMWRRSLPARTLREIWRHSFLMGENKKKRVDPDPLKEYCVDLKIVTPESRWDHWGTI